MNKTLVLMRHGKAQPLEEGQQDFDRELAEAGRRSLAALLPAMLSPLCGKTKSALILSSPAARAFQSAELLKQALRECRIKSGAICCLDALWDQSGAALVEAVAAAEEDVVFAVGHNPFVEQFAFELTGATLPCATGALVGLAIELGDDETDAPVIESARLEWFSQGPASQRWKTLVQLESELKTASETIEEKLAAFMQDPQDAETMHKFRVSIRTARSLVAFVKPWQDPKQNASTQALLKDVVACTSRLRELDVFAEQARQSTASSDELAAFCDAQALAERQKTIDALSSKKISKALELSCKRMRNVRWKDGVERNGLDRKDVRQRFDSLASSLELDVQRLNLADVELTHDVRKNAKRVRYAAEKFKQILGDDAIEIARGMTAHQDNLGAICDARVNIQTINEYLQSDLPETIAWDLTLLRAQNETFLYSTLRSAQANQAEDDGNLAS